MTPAPADKNLQISCPSCSQRFKVGADLFGKTVECGSCESRFEITDEVIVRSQKFYPGERNEAGLSGFNRAPGEIIPASGWKPAGVLPQQEKGYFSPISKVSKLQLVVGWLGILLVLALTFFLGFDKGGPLNRLDTSARLMIALAGGLAALGMIAYANPRNRLKALRIGAIFAVISLAVPFLFAPAKLAPVSGTVREVGPDPQDLPEKVEDLTVDGLRRVIGTQPLEDEIKRLDGSNLHAYGIWLRDLNESNRLAVRDYMFRAAKADPISHIYPRDGRDYLMVLTGVDLNIDEVAAIVARFGRNQKIHRDLSVIETQVDDKVFVEGPMDKLGDKKNPGFYDMNKRELESIQLDRVSRAVKRLADAEPKIYREDITRQLIVLLGVDQVDFPGDVCNALLVWAENPAPAGNAAYERMTRLVKDKKPIPREMVALLAKAKNANALPVVEKLWLDDPTAWEASLGDFGSIAEPGILKLFPDMKGTIRHSAARILGRVGTQATLPVLAAARPTAEAELVVLIDDAVKQIKARP